MQKKIDLHKVQEVLRTDEFKINLFQSDGKKKGSAHDPDKLICEAQR